MPNISIVHIISLSKLSGLHKNCRQCDGFIASEESDIEDKDGDDAVMCEDNSASKPIS